MRTHFFAGDFPRGKSSRFSASESQVTQPVDLDVAALQFAGQRPIGGDERNGHVLSEGGIGGVISAELILRGEKDRRFEKRRQRNSLEPESSQPVEMLPSCLQGQVQLPDVLPEDVGALDIEQVWDIGEQVAGPEESLRLVGEFLVYEQLDHNAGVDNSFIPQRS